MNPSKQRPEDSAGSRFAETRWSLVAGLDLGETERQRCLAELCHTYCFPVYAYIRHRGYPEDQAYDFSLAFFGNLIAGLEHSRPEGRFRTFLLARLDDFLAAPGSPPADPSELRAPDRATLETRFAAASTPSLDLSKSFDADYAREVMARSISRLRHEAEQNGRQKMFQHLSAYLVRDPSSSDYQQLSEALGMSRIGLVVATKRLRARFHALVNRELSETVANPDDLDNERQALYSILRGHS